MDGRSAKRPPPPSGHEEHEAREHEAREHEARGLEARELEWKKFAFFG